MGKVNDFLEMWQGNETVCATQKESCAQNEQVSTVWSISDIEEIVQISCSLFQHHGAAAFRLLERSPLPPPLSAKDLPGGQTQIINVRGIRRINCHPVKSDEDNAPETISDTEDLLNWDGDLDNPNDSKDNCAVEIESDMEQENSIQDPECPEQRDLSATANVPRLIRSTRMSKRQAGKVLVTVNAIETRRNKGVKTK